jgi:hypothetical protein
LEPGLAGDTKRGGPWQRARKQSIDDWRAKGYSNIPWDDKVNHMTPADAGGCPYSSQNLVPNAVLEGDCLAIEEAQTRIQNMLPPNKTERARAFG